MLTVYLQSRSTNLKTNQVRRKLGRRQASVRKTVFDRDVFFLRPSAWPSPDGTPQENSATGSGAWIKITYAEDFPCLLRLDHPHPSSE
jgi:hypothetical protein